MPDQLAGRALPGPARKGKGKGEQASMHLHTERAQVEQTGHRPSAH